MAGVVAVTAFPEPLKALDALSEQTFDIAFYDLKMSPIDGMELLKETRKRSPFTTVIIMTAHGSVDSAIEAIKKGKFRCSIHITPIIILHI